MDGIFAPWHWAILIAVVVLIFGPRKLPELGSSLGKGIRGFKQGLNETQEELKNAMADTPAEKEPVLMSSATVSTTTAASAAETSPVEASPAVQPAEATAEQKEVA